MIWVGLSVTLVGLLLLVRTIQTVVLAQERRLARVEEAASNLILTSEDHEMRIVEIENNKAMRVIFNERGRG